MVLAPQKIPLPLALPRVLPLPKTTAGLVVAITGFGGASTAGAPKAKVALLLVATPVFAPELMLAAGVAGEDGSAVEEGAKENEDGPRGADLEPNSVGAAITLLVPEPVSAPIALPNIPPPALLPLDKLPRDVADAPPNVNVD